MVMRSENAGPTGNESTIDFQLVRLEKCLIQMPVSSDMGCRKGVCIFRISSHSRTSFAF